MKRGTQMLRMRNEMGEKKQLICTALQLSLGLAIAPSLLTSLCQTGTSLALLFLLF